MYINIFSCQNFNESNEKGHSKIEGFFLNVQIDNSLNIRKYTEYLIIA